MRRAVGLVLVGMLLLTPTVVAQTSDDTSTGPDCETPQKALTWWTAQNESLAQAPAPVRSFWDSVRPLLQLGRIDDPAPLCDTLDSLLDATAPGVEPVPALRATVAASNATEDVSEDLKPVAKPAVDSVARSVGQRMSDRVNESASTPERIRLLELTHQMYSEADMEGAQARVELRLRTWETMWQRDVQRTEQHLDRAGSVLDRVNASLVTPIEMGAIPGIVQTLDQVDRQIMADHLDTSGEETPAMLQRIDTKVSYLRIAEGDALVSNLAVTVGIMAVTLGIVFGLRYPLRSLERDVHDLEVTLRGVAS